MQEVTVNDSDITLHDFLKFVFVIFTCITLYDIYLYDF